MQDSSPMKIAGSGTEVGLDQLESVYAFHLLEGRQAIRGYLFKRHIRC